MCVGGSPLGGKVRERHDYFFLQRPDLITPVNGVCPSTTDWSWKGELPSVSRVAPEGFRSATFVPGRGVVVVAKTLGGHAKLTTHIFPTRGN